MDLQEEERAGDDAQVAWEEGDRGEEMLAHGCKAPACGWPGHSPHPITSLSPAPGLE